jgi:hypothetical protein
VIYLECRLKAREAVPHDNTPAGLFQERTGLRIVANLLGVQGITYKGEKKNGKRQALDPA